MDIELGPNVQPDATPGHPVPGMHLWGWMSPAELCWLMDMAAVMDSVVEIGSLHGRSSYALARACSGFVYCVDPWNDAGFASWSSSLAIRENAVPMRMSSPAAWEFLPLEVDMTFIDGDHHLQSVLDDLAGAVPHTRKLICGHDYYDAPDAPDGGWQVKSAVDSYFTNHEVNRALYQGPDGTMHETSIWWVDLEDE